jgi:hypothetical protein
MKRYTLTIVLDLGEHEAEESPRDRARDLVYRLPWVRIDEVRMVDSDGAAVPLSIAPMRHAK